MECWSIGEKWTVGALVFWVCVLDKNLNFILGIMMELNRKGYKQLRVWQDAIKLYVLAKMIFKAKNFEDGKTISHILDACHSINRNIAEGYCRRNLKEYIQFRYVALGSCGELHSSVVSFFHTNQISAEDFETLDKLHFKLENQLIKLVQRLEAKQKDGGWTARLIEEPQPHYLLKGIINE